MSSIPPVLAAPLCALALVSACASGTIQPLDELTGDGGGRETGTDLPNPDPTFDDPMTDDGAQDAGTTGRTGDDPPDNDDHDDNDDNDNDDAGSTGDDGTTTASEDNTTGSVLPDDTSTGDPEEDTGDDTAQQAPPLDLSGWTLVQTNSSRELVLPEDTVLTPGMVLVVGRSASQGEFESFWDISFGEDAIFVPGGSEFPTINGDETYTVHDASDLVVEGPTPMLLLGENLQRQDAGLPAGEVAAWSSSVDPNAMATPGSADPSVIEPGLVITEVSDVNGAGLYVYEFIELTYAVP